MYFILDAATRETIHMVENPYYIHLQKNGCYGPCEANRAEGICHNDIVYHLSGRKAMNGTERDVFLLKKDNGNVTYDLMDELSTFIIDQLYRVTTLELQIAAPNELTVTSSESAEME